MSTFDYFLRPRGLWFQLNCKVCRPFWFLRLLQATRKHLLHVSCKKPPFWTQCDCPRVLWKVKVIKSPVFVSRDLSSVKVLHFQPLKCGFSSVKVLHFQALKCGFSSVKVLHFQVWKYGFSSVKVQSSDKFLCDLWQFQWQEKSSFCAYGQVLVNVDFSIWC